MKQFLLLAFIAITLTSYSQINVGPELSNVQTSRFGHKMEEFNADDLKAMKFSTTYFIYRESDEKHLPELKKTLTDVWELTELKFISYDEYEAMPFMENASFFSISGLIYSQNGASSSYLYLTLNMRINGVVKTFCRIDLHPHFPGYQMAMYANTDEKMAELFYYLYGPDAVIYNWNLQFLKNSFQFINEKLKNAELFWMFEDIKYEDLSMLKNKTLYIPDYNMIRFSSFSGDESVKFKEKDLLKKYPYPYKVIPMNEFQTLAAQSNEPIYYLSMVRSSMDKFIAIFEANSGEMAYYNYSKLAYGLKENDFKELKKAIEFEEK
jgi:hypothetical protein